MGIIVVLIDMARWCRMVGGGLRRRVLEEGNAVVTNVMRSVAHGSLNEGSRRK